VTVPRRDGTDGLAVVVAALIGLDAVLWLAAQCSAWLDVRRLPSGRLLSPFGLAHLGDPSRAWGVRVAGPVLYWTLAGLFLILPVLGFDGPCRRRPRLGPAGMGGRRIEYANRARKTENNR
jgi:hypothetical protein